MVIDVMDAAPADEPPTIILTPDQIALLTRATPPHTVLPTPDAEGYAYLEPEPPVEEPPTVILQVSDILNAPPFDDYSVSDAGISSGSLPAAAPPNWQPHSLTPTRKRDARPDDRDERLAELHRLRTAREDGVIDRLPQEPYISDKLRQWWHEVQPGIDRVLGRAHRAGVRGARATAYQTSAQLPAVRSRSLDADEIPAIRRLSQTAQQIGRRAQTAATPALTKLHSRAERMAQQIVDSIDEHLGGRPPLQHVILGPGRMIVTFANSVSIRDAQIMIAAVQARALRRLVGYNAYLILVPAGREARYAERLHTYRHVTGVHFGPQRPANLSYPQPNAAI
jgi:hypothetical protein